MLPSVNNQTVLEQEDDAAIHLQALPVPLGAVVMNAHHHAVIRLEHMQQFCLESPARQAPIPAELGEDRLPSLRVAGDGALARCVPRGVLVEEGRECLHVSRVEGRIAAPYGFCICLCLVHVVVLLGSGLMFNMCEVFGRHHQAGVQQRLTTSGSAARAFCGSAGTGG